MYSYDYCTKFYQAVSLRMKNDDKDDDDDDDDIVIHRLHSNKKIQPNKLSEDCSDSATTELRSSIKFTSDKNSDEPIKYEIDKADKKSIKSRKHRIPFVSHPKNSTEIEKHNRHRIKGFVKKISNKASRKKRELINKNKKDRRIADAGTTNGIIRSDRKSDGNDMSTSSKVDSSHDQPGPSTSYKYDSPNKVNNFVDNDSEITSLKSALKGQRSSSIKMKKRKKTEKNKSLGKPATTNETSDQCSIRSSPASHKIDGASLGEEKVDLFFLRTLFYSCLLDSDDIDLESYTLAYGEMSTICVNLGPLFKAVGNDIRNKVERLNELRLNVESGPFYTTMKIMVEYELQNKLLKKSGYISGTLSLIKLNRGLNFLARFLRKVAELEPTDYTTTVGCEAYLETMGKYQSWLTRKSATIIMNLALPTKKDLYKKLCGDNIEVQERDLPLFLDAIEAVHCRTEKYCEKIKIFLF